MAESNITALQYPKIWPPPGLPPHPPSRWSHIPILGLPFRYITWLRRSRQHQRDVLEPIADDIIRQLEPRPTHGTWPTSDEQREIAQVISDAVGLEKGLPHSPALHPDDPFPLLFWGPFDDLTPLIVRTDCRDKLKVSLPDNIVMDAWRGRWTISRFITQCIVCTTAG